MVLGQCTLHPKPVRYIGECILGGLSGMISHTLQV